MHLNLTLSIVAAAGTSLAAFTAYHVMKKMPFMQPLTPADIERYQSALSAKVDKLETELSKHEEYTPKAIMGAQQSVNAIDLRAAAYIKTLPEDTFNYHYSCDRNYYWYYIFNLMNDQQKIVSSVKIKERYNKNRIKTEHEGPSFDSLMPGFAKTFRSNLRKIKYCNAKQERIDDLKSETASLGELVKTIKDIGASYPGGSAQLLKDSGLRAYRLKGLAARTSDVVCLLDKQSFIAQQRSPKAPLTPA